MAFYHFITLFALAFTKVMFFLRSIGDAWIISKGMLGLSGGVSSVTEHGGLPPELAAMIVVTALIVALLT